MVYRMKIAGVERDLPICKVNDDLYIGAFVIFGDVADGKMRRRTAGKGPGL